mmetsp:Transcript_43023/g.105176  ORF Transcript_43023/g.105176 Transcript_43023/m.105176 type:complete len:252 (-) Transcript_43023:1124-1879(-)
MLGSMRITKKASRGLGRGTQVVVLSNLGGAALASSASISRFTSSTGDAASVYLKRWYSTRSRSQHMRYLWYKTAAPSSMSLCTRARSASTRFMRSLTRPISEKLAILTACSNWYLRVSRVSISWSRLSSLSARMCAKWRYMLTHASWCWMYMSLLLLSSSVSLSCFLVMTASRMLQPRARASSTDRTLAFRSLDISAWPVLSSWRELPMAAFTRWLSCSMLSTSASMAHRVLTEAFSLLMACMMRTSSSLY